MTWSSVTSLALGSAIARTWSALTEYRVSVGAKGVSEPTVNAGDKRFVLVR